MKLHLFDLSIVVIYLLICIIIAFYRAPKINTPRQFALGYKNISTALLVCIIFASITGGGIILGYTAKLYSLGLIFIIGLLFQPLYWFISARIFASNIEQFKDCISISQIMYKLYGTPGRWVTSITSIIINIGVTAVQASAIGYIFHYFFGIEIIHGILISYAILTLYSALGGTRAIIVTEVFQFSVFFFMLPVSYVIALTNIDDLQVLAQNLPASHKHLEFTSDNIIFLASLIFYTLLPECRAPIIQRYLMASNAKQLSTSLKTIGLISIPFMLSMCLIVYIVKAHSPNVPADEVFLFYIHNYLPIGLKGLMVAGIIGAIMAVADSLLNSTSITLVNDMIKVSYPKISNRQQLIMLRVFVVMLSAISIAVAYFQNNIIKLIWLSDNFWGPLILVPISAGFLGFRTSSTAFIASTIIAFAFTLFGRFIAGEFATTSLSLGIIGSAIGLFGMHYLQTLEKGAQKYSVAIQNAISIWLLDQASKAKKLITIPKNFIFKITNHLQQLSSQKEIPYQKFATFTLVYYFVYTFNLTSDPATKTLSYFLIIGYFLCFILLLRDIIFSKDFQKRYLSLYWHCTLTFCLPAVASYMLFASEGDDFWIINGLLTTFSLYFFVDAITFIILLSVGVLCGYGLLILSGVEHGILHVHNTVSNIGYIYLFFLFAFLVFFRGREKEQEERVATMHMLGGAIAHEVKTPISAMSMGVQAISDILGKTTNTVIQTQPDKYTVTYDKDDYEFLMEINTSMQNLSTQGINMVDGILTSLKNSVIEDEKKIYPIEECIRQIIDEYSKFNEHAKNIEINTKNNFKVKCSPHYLKHVVFNLIKNSYRHGGRDVKIQIRTGKFKLHFKDNGRGIAKEDLPRIFDKFYTKSKVGTGIGLAFCKMVMEDLGGSIECKSQLGKYTEFILTFPNPNIQIA